MQACILKDRGVVAIEGPDAEPLLNRLVTNSMLDMPVAAARYAALLSPQGKLLVDFLAVRTADGFQLDAPRALAPDLARKLTMFKLRAKVTITDRSEDIGVAAVWDGQPDAEFPGITYPDPRDPRLGLRVLAPRAELEGKLGERHDDYEAHRIALGIPRGGADFAYGDTFVHDANLDLLHGVDFGKGCYVGQEVVSRVHHRGSVRKRIVGLAFLGPPVAAGTVLRAAGIEIGTVTSIAAHQGLASARLDRLQDAAQTGAPVMADATLVQVTPPAPAESLAHAHAGTA